MKTVSKRDIFLRKLKESGNFDDKYDYTKVNYVNDSIKVMVIEKSSGNKHFITPKALIKRGVKCSSRNVLGGFLSYDDAKKIVMVLNFNKVSDYKEWSKNGDRPKNIPANPNTKYKAEWKGWSEFLK